MNDVTEQRIKQVLAGRSLLREPLRPILDNWDATFRMSDWPQDACVDGEQHQYKHQHHCEPSRFS